MSWMSSSGAVGRLDSSLQRLLPESGFVHSGGEGRGREREREAGQTDRKRQIDKVCAEGQTDMVF